jgi:prenyltransferase beta subunit
MMHQDDGEVDIRSVYCALSVARLTNTFTTGIPPHRKQLKNLAQKLIFQVQVVVNSYCFVQSNLDNRTSSVIEKSI